MHAHKGDHFKFPGSGIEYDEDHQIACQQEVMEEIGCKVTLDDKLVATAEE
jgi:8-oxo-dGTP pyrophosphatase MutT (NUDIX family)